MHWWHHLLPHPIAVYRYLLMMTHGFLPAKAAIMKNTQLYSSMPPIPEDRNILITIPRSINETNTKDIGNINSHSLQYS